jgi:hypothetical protein
MRETATHEHLSSEITGLGASDRSFGLVMAGFFTLVGFWPLVHRRDWRPWSVAVGAAFALVALAWPSLLSPLNKLWMRLGLLLSRIINPLVLGAMYYLVITPVSLILRLAGKDPLRLRPDRQAASYWIARQPPGPAPETMSDQF